VGTGSPNARAGDSEIIGEPDAREKQWARCVVAAVGAARSAHPRFRYPHYERR